ncbi:MAG: hypothetical protein RI985_180 [Chloroflexota bacterium]|jgi:hypothetical protein
MARYTTASGKSIALGKKLGAGGEGAVYDIVGAPQLVAKIYHAHRLNHALANKVRAMVADPPDDATRKPPLNHVSIAWPTDIVLNGRNFAGYLMPKLPKSDDLYDLLQPQQRKKQHGHLNHRHLYRTARNLALAMEAIHQKNYVLGDVNFKNALFNDDALITIVDCDSMQVTEANGTVHRCIVGMPEYTSPELQGKDFNKEVRTANHDAFGLAVLIFQLLMQGFHPFTGRAKPGTPDVEQSHVYCIQNQIFPYLDNQPYEPPKVAPSFHALPPMLQLLFTRAFTQINNRPTPKEWAQVISMIEKRLVQCGNDANHFYPSDGACVICEIDYNSGRRQRTTPAPRATSSMQVPLNQPAPNVTMPNPTPVSSPNATTGPLRPAPISTPNTSTGPMQPPPQTTTPSVRPPVTQNTSFSIPTAPMGGRLWWSWLLSSIVGIVNGIRRWFKYLVGGIVALILLSVIVTSYQAIVANQSTNQTAPSVAAEPTLAATGVPQATPVPMPTVTVAAVAPPPTDTPQQATACTQSEIIDAVWPMIDSSLRTQFTRTALGDTVASRFGPVLDVSRELLPAANAPVSPMQAMDSCGSGQLVELYDSQNPSFIGCNSQDCGNTNLLPIMPAYDLLIRSGDQQSINVSGRTSLLEQLLQRRTNTPNLNIVYLRQTGLNQQAFANLVMPLLQKPLVTVRNNAVIWQRKTKSNTLVSIPANTKWYQPSRNIVAESTNEPIPQITHVVDLNGLTWQDGRPIMASEYIAWFDSCSSRNDTHPACTFVSSISGSGSRLTIAYLPGVPIDLAETIAPLAIRGGGNSTTSLLDSTTTQWRLVKAFDPMRNQITDGQYTITIEILTDVQQFVARLRRNDTQIAVAEYQYANQILSILADEPLDGNARLELVPTGAVYVVQAN